MKKSSFVFGTILLTGINFLVRSLGFLYRILLSRLIGAKAIGLYQMVFPFLMLLITIPTAGIPVAVSKLVAHENSIHNRKGVYKVLISSILLGGWIAMILSIFVSLKIEFITVKVLKNSQLYYPLLWTIPSISIITFSNILRGFFYGLKDMKPPAGAQIIEQISRILFVLGYLYCKKPSHPITSATIAIIGISVGEILGLAYLLLRFHIKKIKARKSFLQIVRHPFAKIVGSILAISIPITITRLVSVTMQTINAILIPHRLQAAGYSSVEAVEIYGKVSGMAIPLLFLPFTVTSALVVNIIPNISEQLAVNNYNNIKYNSNLALRITLLVAIPVTIVYVFFGEHLAQLIYNQTDVGKYFSIISYATIFMCLQHTLSGILHGMGKQVITTINYLIGMLIQLYCTYFLVSNPQYGINGFFIGFILSSLIIFILNLYSLNRFIKISLPFVQTFLKPIICSIIMIASIFYSYRYSMLFLLKPSLSTMMALSIGAFVYLLALVLTRTFDIKIFFNFIKG